MQVRGTEKAASIRTSKLASDYGLTIQDAHLLKYSGKAIKVDSKIAEAMISDGLAVQFASKQETIDESKE